MQKKKEKLTKNYVNNKQLKIIINKLKVKNIK